MNHEASKLMKWDKLEQAKSLKSKAETENEQGVNTLVCSRESSEQGDDKPRAPDAHPRSELIVIFEMH